MQQAPQPGRHCRGVDCALALGPVGGHLLCFTWNKLVLLVFLLPCPACIGVSFFSGQRGAGSEGASGRASMLAVLPSAGLLSGARTVQVAAQLALSGLKHARHPLAAGQGQTCPSLRASDANKAPGQRPPQPFDAPLSACDGSCPLTGEAWRINGRAQTVALTSGSPPGQQPQLP